MSYNAALLRTAAELVPEGSELVIESLRGIPVYDGDLEDQEGLPGRVSELQSALAGADGVLLVTPEYNAGVPGAAKNAIDWISRGENGKVLKGKPLALIGIGGGGGTRYSQSAWLPTMRMLGARLYSEHSLFAARAWTLFNEERALTDEATAEQLQKLIDGFVAFCDEH